MEQMAQGIMAAKKEAFLGYALYSFFPSPKLGRMQPYCLTQQHNPRGATKTEVEKFLEDCKTINGGLDQQNTEFAIILTIDPEFIANLEEISEWASTNGQDPIDLEWTTLASGQTAVMSNGYHRLLALRMLLDALMKERENKRAWIQDYATRLEHDEIDIANRTDMLAEIADLNGKIGNKSKFMVALYDSSKPLLFPYDDRDMG